MEKLIQAYNDSRLIPFIGSGLSVPFGCFDWSGLINSVASKDNNYYKFQDKLEYLLQSGNYLDSILLIKSESKSYKLEGDIQEAVCNLMIDKHNDLEKKQFDVKNNYLDLLNYHFANYFTFNYDHVFEGVAEVCGGSLHTKLLQNHTLDTQFLHNSLRKDPNLWHIHGEVYNKDSIILSKESYQKQYTDEKYVANLQFFTNNYIFLMIGVSFKDVFVRSFFENNKSLFCKNIHYILWSDNEVIQDEERLLSQYGLNVIRYSTKNGYIEGISEKLGELFNGTEQKKKDKTSDSKTIIQINAKNSPVLSGDQNTLYFY